MRALLEGRLLSSLISGLEAFNCQANLHIFFSDAMFLLGILKILLALLKTYKWFLNGADFSYQIC